MSCLAHVTSLLCHCGGLLDTRLTVHRTTLHRPRIPESSVCLTHHVPFDKCCWLVIMRVRRVRRMSQLMCACYGEEHVDTPEGFQIVPPRTSVILQERIL